MTLTSNRAVGLSKVRKFSLAQKMMAWFAASMFILVFIAVGFLYWALEHHLDEDDQKLLYNKYAILDEILSHHEGVSDRLKDEVESDAKNFKSIRIFSRIISAKGDVLIETKGMKKELDVDFACPAVNAFYGNCMVLSKTKKSLYVLRSNPKSFLDGELVIQIAIDRTDEELLLNDYRAVSIWVLFGTLLISSLIGYIIVRKGMSPLKKIVDSVTQISSSTLNERLVTDKLPKELLTLAITFNEMLDRLERSFSQLSRFSADIAHELRTPLNNIRGEAEVGLGMARTPSEYQDILSSCLEECDELATMIDNLLFLARAEDPLSAIKKEEISVLSELENIRDFFEPEIQRLKLDFDIRVDSTLAFNLDKSLFQRAVVNILTNSFKHTSSGQIRICAWIISSELIVEVEDTGSGIEAVDLPNLFQRFYRADLSRSTTSGNTGLGLSLVRGIMDLHKGSVSISSTIGKGTKVVLSFPRIN